MTHAQASTLSFASIEQMDDLPRELGWPLEYRQLEPGAFSSTYTILERDDYFLLEEQSSRTVEISMGTVEGTVVLAFATGDPASCNGQPLTRDHLFLQMPGSNSLATLPAGVRATQLGISIEQFKDVVDAVAPELQVPARRLNLYASAPDRYAAVRHAMRSALLAPSQSESRQHEAVSAVLAEIIAIAADHSQSPCIHYLHREHARRAIDRAREYIESHLDEAIQVAAMCRYARTTYRSLQRIFARELNLSPQQYVMARRLNAFRRRLLESRGEQDILVTSIAQDFGFSHISRLAEQYRHYFGETPSETLQSPR